MASGRVWSRFPSGGFLLKGVIHEKDYGRFDDFDCFCSERGFVAFD